ncbi:MAG: hypothetical protein HOB20_10830, partial [Planctomycetaceae bacterium]|nr:hypothetical protein [Planctomycetaceae bacterium]
MIRSTSITSLLLMIFLALSPQQATAKKIKPYQPSDLLENYRRAHASINDVNNKMIRHRVSPHWVEEDNKFWYKLDLHAGKREWVVVDCLAGKRQPAFNHTAVGKQLSELLKKDVDGSKLNISELQFDKALTYCEFKFENGRYRFQYKDNKLEQMTRVLSPPNIVTTSTRIAQKQDQTPRWEFEVKNHNAVLVDKENKQEHVLTTDGTKANPYKFNKWAPTRNYVVFMKVQAGNLSKVHLLESSPKDSIKAKLHTRTYAQPGDRFDSFKLFIASTETQKSYAVDTELIDYHGPPRLEWHENNDFFTYQKDDRGHQRVRVIAVS